MPSNAATRAVDLRSGKSPAAFVDCFTDTQERRGAAWAYLPTTHGGMLTDSGAKGAAASYWLKVQDVGGATRIRLFSEPNQAQPDSVRQQIEQCR